VDEYKESIKKNIEEKKVNEAKAAKEDAVIEKIIEGAKMDIPDAMVDSQVRQMAEDFARRLSAQGLSLEQYFQYTGLTGEMLVEQMKPQAIKRIQSRLVLEAVAEKENFEVTEEEIEKEVADMAAAYQMDADKLKELLTDADKDNMKKDIQVKKAVDFVTENAKEV
ncbi:MAG: trigger factor, partial [Lachnospiraceae bacterium]|nr:trigger factor [Lachnospiraceae bacterium]